MLCHLRHLVARSDKHLCTALISGKHCQSPVRLACASTKPLWREGCSTPARCYHTVRVRASQLEEVVKQETSDVGQNVIQSWILQGKVQVNGKVVNKPGTPVSPKAAISINAVLDKYVCRAGHKMEAALNHFQIEVAGMTCLDAGLSTGGFTDALLQNGARKVYGVDVGFGQVAERLRQDPRLVVIDRTNLRYLKLQDLPDEASAVDLVSLDLSFISVLKVMPAVCDVLRPGGKLIVLIKPQFEADRDQVASGGVVRDDKVHQQVIASVTEGIAIHGFSPQGHMLSPITGATSKNKEFLAFFTRDL